MKRAKYRSGFTLVEIIAVLVLLGIILAIAVPSMIGFIEQGKQINRMNIARTVYLAAQNQLTKSMAERTFKSTFAGHYYIEDEDTGEIILNVAQIGESNVAKTLAGNGGAYPAEDKENEPYVCFVSKPKGYEPTGDGGELDKFYKLLEEVIIDRSILNDAILMEYNVKTGVVLSIFYGDMLRIGEEFQYKPVENRDRNNVTGGRGMNSGYEFAEARKQGYYGVGSTGEIHDVNDLKDIINIYDGADHGLQVGSFGGEILYKENVLYAELLLAIPMAGTTYTIEAIDAKNTTSGVISCSVNNFVTAAPETDFNMAIQSAIDVTVNGFPGKEVIYKDHRPVEAGEVIQHGILIGSSYTRYIWVIDYIEFDILNDEQQSSLGYKYASGAGNLLSNPKTVRAKVSKGGEGVTSLTVANTHFGRELADGSFEIKSARHLNNIRYTPEDDRKFRQTDDIDMDLFNNTISNFAPITTFGGEYYAMKDGISQWRIKNLKIDASGATFADVGLFGQTSGTITGLSLFEADIKAASAINVGAIAGRMSGGSVSQSNSYANVSGGSGSTGGLVGRLSSGELDQSFNAGFYNTHDNTLTSSGFGSVTARGGSVGGLVGINNGTIQSSFNNGRVNIDDVTLTEDEELLSLDPERHAGFTGASLGGIAGTNAGTGRILRSYATNFVAVYDDGPESGGIAGTNAGGGTISNNCYYIANAYCADNGLGTAAAKEDLQSRPAALGPMYINGFTYRPGENTYEFYYPYPILNSNNPFADTGSEWGWEDIQSEIMPTDAALVYYEFYNDNTPPGYSSPYWDVQIVAAGARQLVTHDGYCVEFSPNKSGYLLEIGDQSFKVVNNGGTWGVDPSDDPAGKWRQAQVFLANTGEDMCRLYIPNSIAEDIAGKAAGGVIPIALYANANTTPGSGTDSLLSRSSYNPLFANMSSGLIRSARQIDNINKLPGGAYTQQLNIDFAVPYYKELLSANVNIRTFAEPRVFEEKAIVFEEFTGSYTGKHGAANNTALWISHLVINKPGNYSVGMFAHNRGTIQNVTLRDPDINGYINVGAIAGTNEGVIKLCSVQQTAANVASNPVMVSGNSRVGGIVGNNSGTLTDVILISTSNVPSVFGSASSEVGGIVGTTTASAANVNKLMYLAVAPMRGAAGVTAAIYPYSGSGAVGPDTNYLSGVRAVRPWITTYTDPAKVTALSQYNRTDSAVSGTRANSWEIYNTRRTGRWADWSLASTTLTQVIVETITNPTFPYPYPDGTVIPAAFDDWPLINAQITNINGLVYFERYEDGTSGIFTRRVSPTNTDPSNTDDLLTIDLLNNNGVVVECGYAIFATSSGNSYAWASQSGVAGSFRHLLSGQFGSGGATFPLLTNVPDLAVTGGNFYVLPFSMFTSFYSSSANDPALPVYIWLTQSGGGNNLGAPLPNAVMAINPFFAREIYPAQYTGTGATANTRLMVSNLPPVHYIRTPWQMQQVSRINESALSVGKGHTFIQELDLNFGNITYNYTTNPTRPTYSFITNTEIARDLGAGTKYVSNNTAYPGSFANVIRGNFAGIYDGTSKAVSSLTMDAAAIGNKGLFRTIASGGEVKNLTMYNCTLGGGTNNGGFASTNGGTIQNVAFLSPRTMTTAPVSGTPSGGIVWTNSGRIDDALFIALSDGNPIAATGGGTVNRAYYLSGSLPSSFNDYNASVGARKTTQELNALLKHQDAAPFGTFPPWRESSVLPSSNTMIASQNPYPYMGKSPPPSWPVATVPASLAYYEIYEDDSMGFFAVVQGSLPTLGSSPIKASGYCAIVPRPGGYSVKQGAGGQNAFLQSDTYAAVHFVKLTNINSGSSQTVEVYVNDNPVSGGFGHINTLLAKAIFDGTAPMQYYIRTPQQLRDIGKLSSTSGKTFTLERDLDFTGIDLDADGAVVVGTFEGTFDGGGLDISGVTINSTTDNVSLFSVNNGTVTNCKVNGISYPYL